MLTTITLLARRAPRDAHATHRAVESTTTPGRTLWAQPTPDRLILRTATLPDWGAIPGATEATTRADIHPPHQGEQVSWSLIANPSKAVRPGTGAPAGRSRRVALNQEEVRAWVERKLAPALTLTGVDHQRLAPARGRGITITRYAFAGTATVTDPGALADLLETGVGAGKAFGCGLLLLREDG